jgi:hypothetical protein
VLRQNALTLALVAAIAMLGWLFLRPAASPTSVPPPAPIAESKIELPSAAADQNKKSKITPPAPERSTLAGALIGMKIERDRLYALASQPADLIARFRDALDGLS